MTNLRLISQAQAGTDQQWFQANNAITNTMVRLFRAIWQVFVVTGPHDWFQSQSKCQYNVGKQWI